MKIVLVHDWLTGMRGGEKCLEVLCRRFPDADLLTLLHVPGKLSPAIERMRITTSFLQRVPGVGRHYRYLLPLMPRAIESFHIPADTDLVVSLSHAVAKGVRVPAGVPHVCYCFTPMRYAWQLRDDYFGPRSPDVRAIGPRGAWRRGAAWVRNRILDDIRSWDLAASDRVTHFVSISRTIARRIDVCYGRASRIIYPPVDTEFYKPADVPREDFYLCLSALVPYKRIDIAVEACRQLGRRLVVIGAGPDQRRLRRLSGPHTEYLGWQPDLVLRDYLRRARALVFPGHEDFGIVPVEAQACGTPVIAYARGGATETVIPAVANRPGGGILFEDQSAECLADAILQLEACPHLVSSEVARAHARRFNAVRFERELVGYLEEVVGAPSRRLAA